MERVGCIDRRQALSKPCLRAQSTSSKWSQRSLSAVLPAHALLYTLEDAVPYECDGLTAYRERPLVRGFARNRKHKFKRC
jgi:hypothetical protein